MEKKVIAVDLDGTLAIYNGRESAHLIGKPVPKMLERVKKWIAEGHEVIIFTARIENNSAQLALVKTYLEEIGLGGLRVTNHKLPEMAEFWDDRAIAIEFNTGEIKYSQDSKPMEGDTASHYRYTYKGMKLDPARIISIYDANHPLQGVIVKKALCAGNRGKKSVLEDIDDIICAANRWREMILEDAE